MTTIRRNTMMKMVKINISKADHSLLLNQCYSGERMTSSRHLQICISRRKARSQPRSRPASFLQESLALARLGPLAHLRSHCWVGNPPSWRIHRFLGQHQESRQWHQSSPDSQQAIKVEQLEVEKSLPQHTTPTTLSELWHLSLLKMRIFR